MRMKAEMTAPVHTMKSDIDFSIYEAIDPKEVLNRLKSDPVRTDDQWPYLIEGTPKNHGMRFVFGNHKELYCQETPEHFLNRWCMESGSSLAGRTESFTYLTGARVKVPCLINEYSRLIYFPIYGRKQKNNIWICYQTIFNCKDYDGLTLLKFTDGTTRIIPVGYRTIRMQIKRCEQYLSMLRRSITIPELNHPVEEASHE